MFAGRPAEIIRRLQDPRSQDRERLTRFVRDRDQAAFAELVRTHGSMVLAVCRRVTGHAQDAEDAFQAVFLILARQAAQITRPELLSNYLYGVAVRVAQKVRRGSTRRRQWEMTLPVLPEQETSYAEAMVEVYPILDEELAALPAWYREAIVLCDLRGFSRQEAAAALGVPEGTLSSRLANGHKKLAVRLRKRGLALLAAMIPGSLGSTQAMATVPFELLTKSCAVVAHDLAGGSIPHTLIKLTKGGMTVRSTLMLGMFTTVLAVASVLYANQLGPKPDSNDPPKQARIVGKADTSPEAIADDKPDQDKSGFTTEPRLEACLKIDLNPVSTALWNTQGTALAIEGTVLHTLRDGDALHHEAFIGVFTFDRNNSKFTLDNTASFLVSKDQKKSKLLGFTNDGKNLLSVFHEYQLISGMHNLTIRQLKAEDNTPPQRIVDLPGTETSGYAFAADGKTFRTAAIEHDPDSKQIKKVTILELDATTGKRLKNLFTINASAFALSADGKRLAIEERVGKTSEVVMAPTANGKQETQKMMAKGNKVVIYDVDSKSILQSYEPPAEWSIPVTKSKGPEDAPRFLALPTILTFSRSGQRLLVYRSSTPEVDNTIITNKGVLGQCMVLDTEKGKALPALEGLDSKTCVAFAPEPQSFSLDGRLLVISGTAYSLSNIPNGAMAGQDPPPPSTRYIFTSPRKFLTVWDTDTGKVLKTWEGNAKVAFNPARPVLAVIEPDGDQSHRLGLWDFSAESPDKK